MLFNCVMLCNNNKPAKKTSEQCSSCKRKLICQNSAIFEHFQKWPKNQSVFLALAPSIIVLFVGMKKTNKDVFYIVSLK